MSRRHNDQWKPGQIEPGLRRSTTRITKPPPLPDLQVDVTSLPELSQHSQPVGSFLDSDSAHFEADSALQDVINQHANTNSVLQSGEQGVKHCQDDSPEVRLDRNVSFDPLQSHGDEKSQNAELKTAKSLSFEAPEHAKDGERSDALDLIRSQHQCPDCKMQQQIDSIQCKHIKEITDLQRELQLVKKERDDYRQNFVDAQEQIFSLQPRRSDITEDVAIQEYSSLCIAVENWIESRLDAVLDLDAKIFTHSTAVDLTSGTRLLRCITSTPGAANSRNIVGTLQYYIRSAIMNFICHEIFKPELYEIISQQWKLIRTVEKSMENLEPRRDLATIRAWRSETLTAIMATAEYKNARRQRITKLASFLCGCMQVLLPRASKKQLEALQKSITEELIVPAITLSEKFHLSVKVFSQNERGFDGDSAIAARELEDYECRNLLENGRVIRAGTLPQGVQCRYVLDICPGLYCSSVKKVTGAPAKMLKKPQILIAVLQPGMTYESLAGETAISHIYKCIQKLKR